MQNIGWLILTLVCYTVGQIVLGHLGLKRGRSASGYVMAHRRLAFWQVFVLITAMWAAWIYVTELDEAFAVGISAIWFGLAVIVMSLIVAALFVTPFRRLGFVTNSGLLARAYGKKAGLVSGLVIALTFPIFALGNILAAAALLHVLLGWSLIAAEVLMLAIVIAYVAFGGLMSLVYTQTVNLMVMALGMVVVFVYALSHLGALPTGGLSSWPVGPPWALWAVGVGPILVWIFSDLVNVVSAQVEFQAVTAVQDPKTAQRAVFWSSGTLLLFAAVAGYLGIASHVADPHAASGVLALPALVLRHAPLGVQIAGAASIWAAALTWSAPLLFSGASSLGLDVAGARRRGTTDDQTRRLIRWALLIQAAALVGYTLLRPGQLAWWSVFGLTLRNGAIFAPTVGLLLWSGGRARSAVASMVMGVAVGLGWNAATNFSPTLFLAGLNPAWVGTAAGIVVFCLGSIWETRREVRRRRTLARSGLLSWCVLVASALGLVLLWPALGGDGLRGPLLLTGAIALQFAIMASWRPERSQNQMVQTTEPDLLSEAAR